MGLTSQVPCWIIAATSEMLPRVPLGYMVQVMVPPDSSSSFSAKAAAPLPNTEVSGSA